MKSYGAWTRLFKVLTGVLWVLLGAALVVGVIWFVRMLWEVNQVQAESDQTQAPENVEHEVIP